MRIRRPNIPRSEGKALVAVEMANTGTSFEEKPAQAPPGGHGTPRRDYVVSDPETYDRLRRTVVSLSPRSLRSQVDDLTHKALLRLIERDKRVGEANRYCTSYLHRTAYCVIVDEIRSRQRKARLEVADAERDNEEGGTQAPSPDRSPAELLDDQETGQAIRDCLSHLPEHRRIAVLLKIQGHAYVDIAKVLECNIKRVNNLVFRGRSALQDCLRNKGF